MISTKTSLILVVVLLILQFLATPLGMAEEAMAYSETILTAPDGIRLISMYGGQGDIILAVASDESGKYHLLQWKELNSTPDILPISLEGIEISAIDVAPDGEIALTTTRQSQSTSTSDQLNLETVVVWLNTVGVEMARTVIMDDLPPAALKALSGRRTAYASRRNELVIYDEAGNTLSRESVMDLEALTADGEVLYGFSPGTLYQWSLDTYKKIASQHTNAYSFEWITMAADREVYFLNGEGVSRIDLESGEAHPMMESMGTCLGDWNLTTKGFVALSDGLFALFAINPSITSTDIYLQENNFIALYQELKDIQTRTPFVITSISVDLLAQTAASEFQKLHPELKVEIYTYRNWQNENTPREDLVRAMNTELLAGGGGDVLVLDSLPLDAIVSRGMLLDITSIANDVQLLPGIAKSIHHSDGKVYAIPSAFSVFQLWGKQNVVETIHTLPDILNAPLEQGQTRLPMSAQWVDFYAACKQDFTNDEGEVQFQSKEFVDFLDLLYSVFSEIELEAYGIPNENRRSMDKTSLKNGAIAFHPVNASFFNDIDLNYRRDGEEEAAVILMPSLHGSGSSYRPRVILGIPRTAQNPSLSEEFIRLMLSDDMYLQSPTVADFSTAVSKLDGMFERRIEMSNDDTQNTMFILEDGGVRIQLAPSEDFFRALRASFDEISVPYYDDYTITSFIEEEMDALLSGIISTEDAAKAIEQRAFLYLNE